MTILSGDLNGDDDTGGDNSENSYHVVTADGTDETAVGELVQKFLFMHQMMSGLAQNSGLMGRVPGLKGLATARQMRRAMKSGRLGDGAGMPPGMGM